MENIIAIIAFCVVLLTAVILFVYVMASKRKKAVHLYQAAAMQESKGNYAEAITLFEAYLRENEDANSGAQNIEHRIKTLRALITPVTLSE